MFRQYTHKIHPKNNEYTQLSCEHQTIVKSGTSHASPTTNETTVLCNYFCGKQNKCYITGSIYKYVLDQKSSICNCGFVACLINSSSIISLH